MSKEVNNNTAVNLMMHSTQHQQASSSEFTTNENAVMAEGSDGMKEEDLSIKNQSYREVADFKLQQCLSQTNKQDSNGNQTVPSLNNFTSINHPHYFIPMNHMTSGRLEAHSSTGHHLASFELCADEASRKRELRLLKNKEAAKECRRKKKEYVRCLENRVNLLEDQNKSLIEELKSLKELYCQKDMQS